MEDGVWSVGFIDWWKPLGYIDWAIEAGLKVESITRECLSEAVRSLRSYDIESLKEGIGRITARNSIFIKYRYFRLLASSL